MTAMAETGLVFREWNMEMGPYTGKGRLEKLEKLLHAVLEQCLTGKPGGFFLPGTAPRTWM